jgi:hypothetical protein
VFIGIIAAREGFVLSEYPPATATLWVAFTVGAVVSVGLATLVVSFSPATTDLKKRPEWLLVALLSLALICFGLYAGLGFFPNVLPAVNLAAENAAVRSCALGAAFGGVALFGFGSHRAARKARQRRLAHASA